MSAVSAETLQAKYPLYFDWITNNNSKRLRDILYKLRFASGKAIDSKLADMWFIATRSESDIARFEKKLAANLDAGSGYVWTGLVFQATQYFKRQPTQDRLVIYVTTPIRDAWERSGLLEFEITPGAKTGQRLELRPSEIPENAIPLLQALPPKDQQLFYLGYVAQLRWRDVGDAVGLSASDANNRGKWIIERCKLTSGGVPVELLAEVRQPRPTRSRVEFDADGNYVGGPGDRVAKTNAAAQARTGWDYGG